MASSHEPDGEDTAVEVRPDQKTIELQTSELKEIAQDGVADGKPNLTVGLFTTDLVEIKPGAALDLDAKVEVDTQLIPKPPILPDQVFGKTAPSLAAPDPTQMIGRIPPAVARRNRLLVIAIYFAATLALGLAILSRL